jgi:hypothetical protein
MRDSIQVEVDKATFIELRRIFKRVYRPNAANVVFTLANGSRRIEFHGGGTELRCKHKRSLVAELSAKSFASIIVAHNNDKPLAGTITLTFRLKLGEFATPLAGGPAKIQLLDMPPSQAPAS